MKRHMITVNDISSYNPSMLLASSSREKKRLEVVVNLTENKVWFNVQDSNSNFIYTDLQSAIAAYNKI